MISPLAWIAAACFAGAAPPRPAEESPPPPLRIDGRWVLDPEGRPVPPGEFKRGLQTSGLLARGAELWSIGDQRAEWPGQLLRIDPRTARLVGKPIPLVPGRPEGESKLLDDYRSIPNSDFEGLVANPRDPGVLFAITEDKRQWLARIRVKERPDAGPEAAIEEITPIEFPPGVEPFQNDPSNYRLEGIAISDDGATIYLAWERAADRLPRLFSVKAADCRSERPARPREMAVDFAGVPPRADKPRALLNLNDLLFLRLRGRAHLLALARDQERLLLIALPGDGTEKGEVERVVDLDLRAPGGAKVLWVSPEGLCLAAPGNRLFIINDPDSIRGNYRGEKEESAEGNFKAFAPLLFETTLSAALGVKLDG